jgi:osmotically-inducible protein OsmY
VFVVLLEYNRQPDDGFTAMRKSILVVVMCLLASACASMLMGGGASGSAGLGQDRRTAQQLTADDAVTTAIVRRLDLDPGIDAADIKVSTYFGAVTLSGSVASFVVRDRVVSIARDTENVRGVNNQILVNSNR